MVNFHRLAAFIQETYHDILLPEEIQWYETLQAATDAAQRLYIRLLTRKGSVFRLSRLSYPEIPDLVAAAAELASRGLADTRPVGNPAELVAAFTKPELISLLGQGSLRSLSTLSRPELVEQLLSADESAMSRLTATLQGADLWMSLVGHQYWTVFQLGFFGNLYQDSSEFVLSDLGAVCYESYKIDRVARVFATRTQLDAHLRYFECEALLETVDTRDSTMLLELVNKLPAVVEGDHNLQRRVDRYRNRIARQLERLGDVRDATSLYAVSAHPPARERRVRIHLSQGAFGEASNVLAAMHADPFNEAELHVAIRLQRNLQRATGVRLPARPRFRPATTRLLLTQSGCRVERAAQAFYSQFGRCFYTENVLVNAVLGLFIWDIIFYPLAGAFFNPFQSAPADFHEPSFSRLRARLLTDRFTELDDVRRFSARVLDAHECHAGKANPLVRWTGITNELLSLAMNRIPAAHWRAMFQRILNDTREHSAGFPDLVLFRDEGGYEFIEIKGPGDVLQQNQRQWMQYFDTHGIPCRVVHVRWPRSVAMAGSQ